MGLERILLAAGAHDADRTDRLARVATDIAAPADATVILGRAFTEDRFEEMSADLHLIGADDTVAATLASRLSSVRALRRHFEDADIDVRIDARLGDPGSSIVALAADVDADLVVVSRSEAHADRQSGVRVGRTDRVARRALSRDVRSGRVSRTDLWPRDVTTPVCQF